MSRSFYKGFRDWQAAPAFAAAREEASRTPWWHVSPEGEIREATGVDTPPYGWTAWDNKESAERLSEQRKREVALFPESFGKPRVPAYYLVSPAGQIEVFPQSGPAPAVPDGWELFSNRIEALERAHALKKVRS